MPESPVKVLCVCTGNICRSPAAEYILRDRLGDAIDVTSAGTLAMVGQPVAEPMERLLNGLGLEPSGFRARELSTDQILSADLVLTMTRTHRGDVVEIYPRAIKYTFTLKEFARLLGNLDLESRRLPADPAARLRELIPLALAERRQVPDARLDEVVDPYRREPNVYAESFRDIATAVDSIARAVGDIVEPRN